jgi:hypothetical protein
MNKVLHVVTPTRSTFKTICYPCMNLNKLYITMEVLYYQVNIQAMITKYLYEVL